MATSRNACSFIGRLGADPEVRYTQNQTPVTNFRIAVNERLGKDNNGNKREITTWVSGVAWRKLAELIGEYSNKGDLISIMGSMRNRSWKDKEGNDRFTTEILTDSVEFLTPKNNGNGGNGGNGVKNAAEEIPPMPDESYLPPVQPGDIPF